MTTLIAVVILIVIGFLGRLFWPTILDLATVPGAIIGLPFGKLVDTRFAIGLLVAHRCAILRLSRLCRARCSRN